jgi:hypothetical protein
MRPVPVVESRTYPYPCVPNPLEGDRVPHQVSGARLSGGHYSTTDVGLASAAVVDLGPELRATAVGGDLHLGWNVPSCTSYLVKLTKYEKHPEGWYAAESKAIARVTGSGTVRATATLYVSTRPRAIAVRVQGFYYDAAAETYVEARCLVTSHVYVARTAPMGSPLKQSLLGRRAP